jgi:hypothetical protein
MHALNKDAIVGRLSDSDGNGPLLEFCSNVLRPRLTIHAAERFPLKAILIFS